MGEDMHEAQQKYADTDDDILSSEAGLLRERLAQIEGEIGHRMSRIESAIRHRDVEQALVDLVRRLDAEGQRGSSIEDLRCRLVTFLKGGSLR